MSNFVCTDGACEALGHPSECTEPVDGTVHSTSSTSVSINGTEIATVATADLSFDEHSHNYTNLEGCHDNQSHTLDPETISSSVTINGSPLYIEESGVATDPITGGNINITSSGSNNSVIET
jgi:uncharacterized Zn-binding protein involved in type VI secretion